MAVRRVEHYGCYILLGGCREKVPFVSREALSPGTGPAGLDLGLAALRTVRHSFPFLCSPV